MIVDALQLAARVNLIAGVAIVLVALLRQPVRAIFGAPTAYILWALPLMSALASLVPVADDRLVAPILLDVINDISAAAPLETGAMWPALVGGAWLAGAGVCATLFAAQQLQFERALRDGAPAVIAGRRLVRARRTDLGPAVVGRTIIVPLDFEDRYSSAEQAAVLAHETQHLMRGDVVANSVVALIQCLCWFNPLVHLAARWIRFDQEAACDAAVIAARPGLRRPYAEALLKAQMITIAPPVGCAWRARGFAALRSRIRLLKQRPPSAPRRVGGALVLAALISTGGYAAWAAQPSRVVAVTNPVWSHLPSGSDLERFYPHNALTHERGGRAVMRCRVDQSGALAACTALHEAPRGSGFGKAVIQMAPLFRMKLTDQNGRPVAGRTVKVPVRFEFSERGADHP